MSDNNEYTDIRLAFHQYLADEGFKTFQTPRPGSTYPSSHVEAMWGAWLTATLLERNKQ